ncbi:MAG: serine hydrolase, partial [Bacteroidota bacterium]
MLRFKIARLLVVLWLSSVSCQKRDDITTEIGYSPPIIENDGWKVGTLSEVGIDQKKIEDLEMSIESNEYTGIQSILIVRNGKLVYEQYFNGQTKNDLHSLYSVTKSFSSALLGIGIEQGCIDDLEVPLYIFFPNKQDFFTEEKKRIQLKHLLSMSSGLEWDEFGSSYTNSRNSHRQMMQSPSQINFVLNQPMVAKPGQRFTYIKLFKQLLFCKLFQVLFATNFQNR